MRNPAPQSLYGHVDGVSGFPFEGDAWARGARVQRVGVGLYDVTPPPGYRLASAIPNVVSGSVVAEFFPGALVSQTRVSVYTPNALAQADKDLYLIFMRLGA